jgi:hypothetical protein
MRELRTIDIFDQKCLEALLACDEYFEGENSPVKYQNDANKISRNFSSGHAEKPTRKTLKARKHGKSRSKGNIFKKGEKNFEKIPSSERV